MGHQLYERHHQGLLRFQDERRSPDEQEIHTGDATVLIFGMGRIGTGAYETLDRHEETRVLAFDVASEVVAHHQQAGRRILRASATDSDFWSRLRLDHGQLRLVLLALPSGKENAFGAEQLLKNGYTGRIAAMVKFDDDVELMKAAGVHCVFNLYTEAGAGFAADACRGVIDLDPKAAPASDP